MWLHFAATPILITSESSVFSTDCCSKLSMLLKFLNYVISHVYFNAKLYRLMSKLYERFGGTDKFEILAFPCNQFGAQEPWEDEEVEVSHFY
jgi:glutathione peroxidase-family protein